MLPPHLTRATLLNLAGQGVPALLGLLTVPVMLRHLGLVEFGAFAIAWAALGYLTLFDLGVGRATTKAVAEADTTTDRGTLRQLVGRALRLQLGAGLVGAGTVALAAAPLATILTRQSPEAYAGLAASLRLIAAGLPVLLLHSTLLGTLEGRNRFDLVNAVRLPTNVLMLILPLAAVSVGGGLVSAVGGLVAARATGAAVSGVIVHRTLPPRDPQRPSTHSTADLLRFGGWLTVSNVIGPLMVQSDRFILGVRAGLAPVSFYTIPFDLVTRLWLIPGSLSTAVFPSFAAALRDNDATTARSLLFRASIGTAMAVSAVTIPAVVGANWLLTAWLNAEFAAVATVPTQMLLVAVTINSAAWIPLAFVQAAGRPDLPALSHVTQVVPYLALVWWLAGSYGPSGAAVAFLIRISIDAGVIFALAARLVRRPATAPR